MALAIGLAAVVSGCASAEKGTSMNLDEAKARTLAVQQEIVDLVPPSGVLDNYTKATSKVLWECDGGYYWPGHTTLKLDADVDRAAVVASIASRWQAAEGWTVGEETTDAGNPALDLKNSDGTRVFVVMDEAELTLDLSSYSPCFALEGGPQYGVEY